MYRHKGLFFCFILVFQSALGSYPKVEQFSLLSWNILGPKAPDYSLYFPGVVDAEETSEFRLYQIANKVGSFAPGIVCLQEVSSDTLSVLLGFGLNMQYSLASLCPKGRHGGAVVLYDRMRFKVLGEVACHLEGGGVAACAHFQYKNGDTSLIVCSLHLSRCSDRSCQDQGLTQLNQCMDCIERKFGVSRNDKTIPIIFAGDFNTYYEEVLDYVGAPKLFDGNWKMFKHSSWTENSPFRTLARHAQMLSLERGYSFTTRCDDSFVSVDHILYRHLELIYQYSFVGSQYNEYVDPRVKRFKAPFDTHRDRFWQDKLGIQRSYFSDHLPLYAVMKTSSRLQQIEVAMHDEAVNIADDIMLEEALQDSASLESSVSSEHSASASLQSPSFLQNSVSVEGQAFSQSPISLQHANASPSSRDLHSALPVHVAKKYVPPHKRDVAAGLPSLPATKYIPPHARIAAAQHVDAHQVLAKSVTEQGQDSLSAHSGKHPKPSLRRQPKNLPYKASVPVQV